VARIVLVDDEAGLRTVMAEILTGGGHEVLTAGDGGEGLAVVRRERPDLVLCDINMPGLDGFEVLQAIRGDPDLASPPFVFLTGETEVRAGMRSGADDYLMKPVASDELLAAVAARLARHDAARRDAESQADEVRRAVTVLLPHELRTPLTTILGSARLIQEMHRELGPEEIGQLSAGIVKAAERLHRMAENYILYADLEMQRLTREPGRRRPLSGTSSAEHVRAAAEAAAEQRGRATELVLDLHEAPIGVASPYVRKAVSELVDNAFKFSPAGTPVTVSLASSSGPPAGSRLEVTDHGVGMPAEAVRAVAAFQQFDRARFEQQGSGVGLALVRRIVETAGGRLEIQSRPAEGTTIRVHWPA